MVGSILITIGMIFFFIFMFLYWLGSRRGIFIAMVVMILSLAFCVIHIVFIALAAIGLFVSWWIAVIVGCVLSFVILILGWLVIRDDIFYFETREESKTHRGYRKTLNMFDVLATPKGLMKREYDRKVMAKISYEQTHDKKVRMEVIQLRDWDTKEGQAQGRRVMDVFVTKMRGKEGPMFNKEPVSESVKYTIYSQDINLDDKLRLVKAHGFQVMDSGKERGLEYYDLELVGKPLFGIGPPTMGADKPKVDFEKDSGWKHGKDAKKDKDKKPDESPDRDESYDYDREREKERERKEKDRDAYEHERDRKRDRDRDEDVDDWSGRRRSQDRSRQRRREPEDRRPPRRREEDHSPDRWPIQQEDEPSPQKPKRRPPPPKIVAD
jgi:hypothetical protein